MLRRNFLLGGFAITSAAVAGCTEGSSSPATQSDTASAKPDGVSSGVDSVTEKDLQALGPIIRKSIGREMGYLADGVAYIDENTRRISGVKPINAGSIVLLDQEGTVVFCSHQTRDDISYVATFFPEEHVRAQADLRLTSQSTLLDIAFGTIPPAFVEHYNLQPIKWGETGNQQKPIMIAGFAEGVALLVGAGEFNGYSANMNAEGAKGVSNTNCKNVSSEVTVLHGMSGGGVLDKNASFVGIINASNSESGIGRVYFTPVEAIKAAYVNIFPERAERAAVGMPPATSVRPECSYDKAQFTNPNM